MTFIEQSYRRSLPALLVLALALFVVGTNAFVIAGLLPRVGEGIGATATQVSWSITTYSLVVAVAAPAVSVLLPRAARRRRRAWETRRMDALMVPQRVCR